MLLGQFRHFYNNIYDISALVIEAMNANWNEAITLGVGDSSLLRQGIAAIYEGVGDEKQRQVVAKLANAFLEQDIPENLSQIVRDLPQQQNAIVT